MKEGGQRKLEAGRSGLWRTGSLLGRGASSGLGGGRWVSNGSRSDGPSWRRNSDGDDGVKGRKAGDEDEVTSPLKIGDKAHVVPDEQKTNAKGC